MKRTNWGEVIGWGFLGLLGVAVLNGIAQNPNVSPKTRFIAQTAEGQIVQDLETGVIRLLV